MASSSSRSSSFSPYSPCQWDFIAPKCNCRPSLDCKLHVSTSLRNPRKAYWRCDFCKYFDWVGPQNMVWTGDHEAPLSGRLEGVSVNKIEQELVALKEKVAEIGVSIKELIKFGLIMFVLLVVIVKM